MRKTLIALLIASLSGCISLPTLRKPSPDLPKAWPQVSPPPPPPSPPAPLPPAGEGLGVREQRLQDWWTLFNDPALTTLINEA
ncbi:MAG: hypothetical protein KKG92_04580, partial [Gammaproteobacteria bacterium]|nr:hypothetical protein [Gammaproteobacteria bacterium]